MASANSIKHYAFLLYKMISHSTTRADNSISTDVFNRVIRPY